MTIGESRVWTPWTVYHLTVAFKHQQELAESVFESVTSTLRTNSIRGDRTATYLGKVIWRRRSIFWVCTTGNSPRSELELWLTREQHLPFFRAFFFWGGGGHVYYSYNLIQDIHLHSHQTQRTPCGWEGRLKNSVYLASGVILNLRLMLLQSRGVKATITTGCLDVLKWR